MAKVTAPETPSVRTYPRTYRVAEADSFATTKAATGLAGVGGFASRMLTTIIGAGLLMAGGLLEWIVPSVSGGELSYRVFYRVSALEAGADFLSSAGAIIVLIGIVAVAGMANFSGVVTRLMGALGLIAFALFGVTMGRSGDLSFPSDVGLGAWLVLAGSIVAIVAGFVASRRRLIREI